MNKTKISIERQINDRQYQFIVPYEASLSEVLIIVEDVRKYVLEKIAELESQQSDQKENKD